MFFFGSQIMPLKPMQQDLKLGSGCTPQTQIKAARTRTVSEEDMNSSHNVEKVSNTEKCKSEVPLPAQKNQQDAAPKPDTHGDLLAQSSKRDQLPIPKKKNKSKTPRRSIFSQYMKEEDASDSNDDSAACDRHPADILEFSPPPDQNCELQKRFSLLHEFSLEKAQDLPPLPTPLVRYTSDAPGVYPLVEPKSILRNGKYSSRIVTPVGSSSSISEEQDTVDSENALNDTYWYKTASRKNDDRHRQLFEFERIALDLNLEDSKKFFRRSESSGSDRERLVKFDPRIVVTEFPDEPDRDWFNEDDLNRFKRETLMLAQHFMMLHPEVADEYSSSKIDPITGTVRKKALYAMPGLCSADGLDAFGSSGEIERLLKNAVRKILIVDPNKSILDLFRKSVQEMFPTATFTLVESGEEALRLYAAELERQKSRWDGHNRGFDIVIVEEQLSRPRANVSRSFRQSLYFSPRWTRMRSDSSAYPNSSTVLSCLSEDNGMQKSDSMSDLESLPVSALESDKDYTMSGSQLIEKICQLEDEFYSLPQNSDKRESEAVVSDDSSVFAPPQRWSLLIGVTVNVGQDSEKLKDSGADLVWGKPPPTMDVKMRNKLISALIAKRQKASFCVKIPNDTGSL